MLTLTNAASTQINTLLEQENDPKIKLRIFVEGGGCSGMSYGFTFDDEQNEDDFVQESSGTTILVDAMSFQYLQNATVDYKETAMGSHFAIDNPNASSSCGCGSSFAPN
jgi:iron-sulfur cluster insertion protein